MSRLDPWATGPVAPRRSLLLICAGVGLLVLAYSLTPGHDQVWLELHGVDAPSTTLGLIKQWAVSSIPALLGWGALMSGLRGRQVDPDPTSTSTGYFPYGVQRFVRQVFHDPAAVRSRRATTDAERSARWTTAPPAISPWWLSLAFVAPALAMGAAQCHAPVREPDGSVSVPPRWELAMRSGLVNRVLPLVLLILMLPEMAVGGAGPWGVAVVFLIWLWAGWAGPALRFGNALDRPAIVVSQSPPMLACAAAEELTEDGSDFVVTQTVEVPWSGAQSLPVGSRVVVLENVDEPQEGHLERLATATEDAKRFPAADGNRDAYVLDELERMVGEQRFAALERALA